MAAPLKQRAQAQKPQFRARGAEGSRLEALSDGVFAFALTLLVVSLQPPGNFAQLVSFARDIPAFGFSLALLVWIWYMHSTFFMRYGLQDKTIVKLNVVLLFLVLLYVYPLKFLFKFITYYFGNLLGALLIDPAYMDYNYALSQKMVQFQDLPPLMLAYCVGYMAIFYVFYRLYRHALKNKEALDLNAYEVFTTRAQLKMNKLILLITLLPATLALIGIISRIPWFAMAAGMSCFLYGPILAINGRRQDKLEKELFGPQHIENTV